MLRGPERHPPRGPLLLGRGFRRATGIVGCTEGRGALARRDGADQRAALCEDRASNSPTADAPTNAGEARGGGFSMPPSDARSCAVHRLFVGTLLPPVVADAFDPVPHRRCIGSAGLESILP